MSFTITKKLFGNHSLYELADSSSQNKVGIISSCGAALNSFLINTNNNYVDVVNGYKSSADLDENLTKNFKGVMLSPFANRVNKASYDFNNSNYVLDKVWKDKDYAIHGYLYNQSFEVENEIVSDNNATLILKNKYDGTLPGFPFTYETTAIYMLQKDNQLSCKTIVQNTSYQVMPLSFGWHPLFFNDVNVNDVELEFPALYQVDVDENYIPNGNKIPYNAFNQARKIEDTFFDYCFKLSESESSNGNPVGHPERSRRSAAGETYFNQRIKLLEPSNKINIELNIETGINKFKYLQIYIPPQRNTIALEPMSSWPDAFNNKEDLITLQPGEIAEFNYGIKVSTTDKL